MTLGDLNQFRDWIVFAVPYAVTTCVSIYAMRQNRKLKELDLKDAQRQRLFEIERTITIRCLDGLSESRALVEGAIHLLIRAKSGDRDALDELKSNSEEWAHTVRRLEIFLPSSIRTKVIAARSSVSLIVRNFGNVDAELEIAKVQECLDSLKQIDAEIASFVDEHNLLNDPGWKTTHGAQ